VCEQWKRKPGFEFQHKILFSRNSTKVSMKKGKVYSVANCSLNSLRGKSFGNTFKFLFDRKQGGPLRIVEVSCLVLSCRWPKLF